MTPFIKKLLSPVLSELKITDYTLEINSGSAKGDGYLGDIYSVKIKHQNRTTDLIVKVAAKDETTRKDLLTDILFRNEINFYTKIYPKMDKFQNEKHVSNPFEITKCYTSSVIECEEALILENLKVKGFKLHGMKENFDRAHIIFVLNHYAKFHALSFALRTQCFEVFKEISEYATNIVPLMYPNFIDAMKLQMRKCAENLKYNGLIEESKAAEKIAENAENIFYINEQPPDEYTVIAHGDCWANNMMFKYDDNNEKPIEMRLLDFQIIRTVSPTVDIAHFLCLCASIDVINNLDDYLQIYYKSLSDFLKQLDVDVEKVFPFKIFMEHWKKYAKFGLAMMLFALRVILSEGDEVISLASKEEFARTLLIHKIERQEEHDERIKFVFKKFVKSGWVD